MKFINIKFHLLRIFPRKLAEGSSPYAGKLPFIVSEIPEVKRIKIYMDLSAEILRKCFRLSTQHS